MLVIGAEQVREALAWPALIDKLAEQFRAGCEMPVRHHHDFAVPGEEQGTLLLMPAWIPGEYQGVKIANVVPGNSQRKQPVVSASYLLSCGKTGSPLAMINGAELTNRRTAAASALAARYLARQDAAHLLMVGTGSLSLNLIQAHAAVRPIKQISVWGRTPENAEKVAAAARQLGFDAEVVVNLQSAVSVADIISCATVSQEPLILGDWLAPGVHLDLVGAFKPEMRETDDRVMAAAEVFVDTKKGALKEAGDIVQPIKSGAITEQHILADLYDLTRGEHSGRASDHSVTVFKSVGAAIEDLAAAVLCYECFNGAVER